jgi:hypothetical protein
MLISAPGMSASRPEHAAAARIGSLEVLVYRPEGPGVEVLGESDTVQSDTVRHPDHAGQRGRLELEVLRHQRVRVGVDPLHSVRPPSSQ